LANIDGLDAPLPWNGIRDDLVLDALDEEDVAALSAASFALNPVTVENTLQFM
jgi:hypothetical protein